MKHVVDFESEQHLVHERWQNNNYLKNHRRLNKDKIDISDEFKNNYYEVDGQSAKRERPSKEGELGESSQSNSGQQY